MISHDLNCCLVKDWGCSWISFPPKSKRKLIQFRFSRSLQKMDWPPPWMVTVTPLNWRYFFILRAELCLTITCGGDESIFRDGIFPWDVLTCPIFVSIVCPGHNFITTSIFLGPLVFPSRRHVLVFMLFWGCLARNLLIIRACSLQHTVFIKKGIEWDHLLL